MIGHGLLRAHDYALVDRAQHAAGDLPAGLEIHPLVPPALRDSARLMPGLVCLSDLAEPLLLQCLELMEGQAQARQPLLFAALLKSPAPLERVAGHLRATLLARIQDSGDTLYLRQFDPRLFVQYAWLMTPEQRLCLFGPVTEWTVYLDGEWLGFQPPAGDVRSRVPVLLEAAQAAQLEDLQTVNETLALLDPDGIASRQQRARELYRLLEHGRGLGLVRLRDLALFLEHGVTVHPRFYTHPLLQQRLQSLPTDADLPYTVAVGDLAGAGFQQIRTEMTLGAGGPLHEP